MNIATPEQSAAIKTDAPHVLVLAPAGSGKTHVFVLRVQHLLETGVPPTAILCLTFTRRAAGELRERLLVALIEKGDKESAEAILNDLTIGTVHAVCKKFIETYADRLGYATGRDLHILDAEDAEMLLVDVAEGLQVARDGKWKRGLSLKQARQALEAQYAGAAGFERDAQSAAILKTVIDAFHARCREMHVLTFGLILSECRRLFDQNPDVLETMRQRYQYVLVDECQDSSSVEFSLYELLGETASTFLVGDLRQAIFGWRFARPDMLKTWITERAPEMHDLRRCFRCGDRIVEAANRLIAHNVDDPGEPMIGETGRKGSIKSYGGPIEHIVGLVRNWIDDGLYGPRDVAVIARKHSVLAAVEDAMQQHGIACQRIGAAASATKNPEFLTLNAAVRLVLNPRDRLSYLRMAQALGVGASDRRSIALEAADYKTSEWFVLIRRMVGIKQRAVASLIQSVGPSDTDPNWMANLGQAVQLVTNTPTLWAAATMLNLWPKDGTIADLAATVRMRRSDTGEDYRAVEAVTLLTAHAAKGLEWPAVIVAELNDGVFPSAMSLRESGGLEEERRCAYVSITRAREELIIHYQTEADQRQAEARVVRAPSRFIEESGLLAIREDVAV